MTEPSRKFRVADFQQPSEGVPIRSVITQSDHCAIICWTVIPGQRILPHIHPNGQDTWTVLSGSGEYQIDATGTTVPVSTGDVLVARAGDVHGVLNTGSENFVFVSVVAPIEAGFELLA